jgi:hypothetical protein
MEGDLSSAERFAEQTYANLRDIKNGMDQEGEKVAEGAYDFADVIFRQEDGDLIKAEGLAREAIRIRDNLPSAPDNRGSVSFFLFANILVAQGKLRDEIKQVLERSLAISVRNKGSDGANTVCGNAAIGEFHYKVAVTSSTGHTKQTQLLLAIERKQYELKKRYIIPPIRIVFQLHPYYRESYMNFRMSNV